MVKDKSTKNEIVNPNEVTMYKLLNRYRYKKT